MTLNLNIFYFEHVKNKIKTESYKEKDIKKKKENDLPQWKALSKSIRRRQDAFFFFTYLKRSGRKDTT